MNHFTTVFVLLLSAQFASAQTQMPDFTVIDSKGEKHSLYQDYLDKDKTVLIKFFYSACPPCNSIARDLQILYDNWGAGSEDVEFFELSIQSWETNSTVNDYLENHSITFPAVSAQGNSLQAISAIESAGYGPVISTPTFAVIAPDKHVNWNVKGSNNAATIAAIDQALAATGASKSSSSVENDPADMHFDIRIHPNPVSNLLNVSMMLPVPGEASIVIYSIIGNKIEEISLGHRPAGQQQIQHIVSTYKSGNYIVRAQLDDIYLKTIRFIKS